MAIALVRPALLQAGFALGLCAGTARWVLMLLAWFWLGEQGIKEAWLYASGVWPLVVWWASRSVAKQAQWHVDVHTKAVVVSASGTIAAIFLAANSVVPDSFKFLMLLLGAVCWGICSGVSEHAQQRSDMPQHAASPLIAALLVGALWWAPAYASSSLVVVTVLVCATVMAANVVRTVPVSQSAQPTTCLAPLAMGLMMGTMWQSSAWCVGLGWSATDALVAHLLLMAALPAVVMQFGKLVQAQAKTLQVLTLGMLAAGSLLLSLAGSAYWVAGMALHALAWSLQYVQPVHVLPSADKSDLRLSQASQGIVLAAGPVALWLIGETIQHNGPLVLQVVQMLLCCACMVALCYSALQRSKALM